MGKKKKQKKDDITYRNNKKKEERNAKKEFQKSKAKYSREPLNRKNWRLFAEQLKGFGLVLRDIQGDGNCMFRSIADQLEGHQDKHRYYRNKIVAFMEENPDHFSPYIIDEPFASYLKKMGRDCSWGGNLELVACTKCFNVHITVHQFNKPRFEIKDWENLEDPETRRIHLSYHDMEHYSSVRKQGDNSYDAAEEIKISSSFDKIKISEVVSAAASEPQNQTERIILQSTGCSNMSYMRDMLEAVGGDMDAVIEILIAEKMEGVGWAAPAGSDGVVDGKKSSVGGIDSNSNSNENNNGDGDGDGDGNSASSDGRNLDLTKNSNLSKTGKEKCPCGSGEKNKKCCMKKDNRGKEAKDKNGGGSGSDNGNNNDNSEAKGGGSDGGAAGINDSDGSPPKVVAAKPVSNKERRRRAKLEKEKLKREKKKKGKKGKLKTKGSRGQVTEIVIEDLGSVSI